MFSAGSSDNEDLLLFSHLAEAFIQSDLQIRKSN